MKIDCSSKATNPKLLKLEEQRPKDWAFNRPDEWDFFDRRLEKAEEAERAGDLDEAVKLCRGILDKCSEYLPAFNMLGMLHEQEGDLERATEMFEAAVEIGKACVPKEFELGKDLIPWYWTDNRAFLIACERLGMGHLEQSLQVMRYLRQINPDNLSNNDVVSRLTELSPFEDGNDES